MCAIKNHIYKLASSPHPHLSLSGLLLFGSPRAPLLYRSTSFFFPFAPDWLWLREVSAPRFERGIKKCGACWWRRRPSPVPGVAAQSFAQRTSWSLNPQCFRCCRRDTRGAGLFLDAHRNYVWILNIDSPNKRRGFSDSAPSSPGVCKSNTQWSQHFNQVEGQHWYSLGKSSSG